MIRPTMILAFSLLTSNVPGADDASRFAGEWQTTRGPLTLEAKENELTGRLVFWKLPVQGQVKDGKLILGYDEGPMHFDSTLEVDPSGRSFAGLAVANNGTREFWNGWRFDPTASKGAPADFSGLWLTDLGLMELKLDGSKVSRSVRPPGDLDHRGGSEGAAPRRPDQGEPNRTGRL